MADDDPFLPPGQRSYGDGFQEEGEEPGEGYHPLEDAAKRQELRHHKVVSGIWQSLERRNDPKLKRIPAWAWEAISDHMTYTYIRSLTGPHDMPHPEVYPVWRGHVEAYRQIAEMFSSYAAEAAKRQEGSVDTDG